MNKIAAVFEKQKAFVAYIMAGDPSLEKTAEYIIELQKSGTDIIELGIPFSDPIAEGKVIQAASIRALRSGACIDGIFAMLENIKDKVTIPLAFMTYINPVFVYGYERFFAKCQNCGIAAIILPDLPFEEQDEIIDIAKKHSVDCITLIAPTSSNRIQNIAQKASGYIYLVSSMGVTGMRSSIQTDLDSMIDAIRKSTDTPVAVGFGITTPEQAAAIAQKADGVIIGSAIVDIIAKHKDKAAQPLRKYAQSIKKAIS